LPKTEAGLLAESWCSKSKGTGGRVARQATTPVARLITSLSRGRQRISGLSRIAGGSSHVFGAPTASSRRRAWWHGKVTGAKGFAQLPGPGRRARVSPRRRRNKVGLPGGHAGDHTPRKGAIPEGASCIETDRHHDIALGQGAAGCAEPSREQGPRPRLDWCTAGGHPPAVALQTAETPRNPGGTL